MITKIEKTTAWFGNKNETVGYFNPFTTQTAKAHKMIEVNEMLVDKISELVEKVNYLETRIGIGT